MADGTFGADGRFEWEVTDAHTFDGEDIDPSEAEGRIDEVDELFYHVTDTLTGEDFYRWVAGPFEDLAGAAEAIADQESDYLDIV